MFKMHKHATTTYTDMHPALTKTHSLKRICELYEKWP